MDTTLLNEILREKRFGEPDCNMIRRAFDIAQKAHDGQKRRSGENYIAHPLKVAHYLAHIGLDAATVSAALLHDTLEDTHVTPEMLTREFGQEVAFLVQGVTKLGAIAYRGNAHTSQSALHIESLKKMFFAMAEDIRVILIKLADRLHNVETLQHLDPESQLRIARETLEIYAPIASRLGMGNLKGQLEDAAFPYVYPEAYRMLAKNVKAKYEDRLRYIERTKPIIARHLGDAGIDIMDIHARAKRYYSLYEKLHRYHMELDKVVDLVAMRIIVPDVKSCYEALGVIHQFYKPLLGRIKDYIAVPKPNGYRSLHTTVFCEKGRVVEIQIRTPEMHEHAENGIAAHWAYGEAGKRRPIVAEQHEVEWVAQLRAIVKNVKTNEGLQNLKIDFFKNRIFVFTPRGEVKDLPDGATPIDFAYAIHTDIGHATASAKVNDRIVPFDHVLKNGDVIEIIKSKTSRPSFGWLKIVKTAQARQNIKAWFKSHDPRAAIADGKELMNKALKKFDASFEKLNKEQMRILLLKYSAKTPDALLTRVSVGDLDPLDVAKTLFKEKTRAPRSKNKAHLRNKTSVHPSIVAIEGQTGMLYKLGRCCNPQQGQVVRGYVTRARGVTVHLASCANIKNADEDRILGAKWS